VEFKAHQGGEATILISVDVDSLDQYDAEEFYLLAQSAGADIVEHLKISRHKPDAKYFIGSGKAAEIAAQVAAQHISLAIFEHGLSPAQERNLEKILQCRVIDRTGLILDIFAQRARTHEGQLQVELAQLKHLSTRLIRGWGDMEQQKGGIGLRGPGETQLETDRRIIRLRMRQLQDKIEKVRQTRVQGRAARQKADIPTLSLVGYTNAGKSTLFNRLADSQVYAANQLFATLDPTLRRVNWSGLGPLVLADTVGFIQNLNHALVDSFRATLEETLHATILLHVIDASSVDVLAQISAVEEVLREIGADQPILRVYNKIDRSGDSAKIVFAAPQQPDRVYVSAQTAQGLDLLQQAVAQLLLGPKQHFQLSLSAQHGKLYSQLHDLQVIQSEQYDEHGQHLLQVCMAADQLKQLLGVHHADVAALLGEQAQQLQRPLEEFEHQTQGASPVSSLDH
jgi:GTP-binding protein HflX